MDILLLILNFIKPDHKGRSEGSKMAGSFISNYKFQHYQNVKHSLQL